MAEAIGVLASGMTIGTIATGITSSIIRLKLYWDQVKDAPDDIHDLIEELDDLGHLLADIEDDQLRNPISHLIFGPNPTSRCLQHCKRGADRLKELTDGLSADLDSRSRFKRTRASAKVVLKKSQIDRCRGKLERAIRLLSLSHQIYTRVLLQLQPDIIVAKLSQNTTYGKPLLYEIENHNHTSALSREATVNGVVTTGTPINLRSDQSWNLSGIFGTFRYSRSRYPSLKKRNTDHQSRKEELEVISVEYRSPSWLVKYVWRMRAVKSTFGWTFCPRTYNIIPNDSLVFVLAKANNVKGLQELFGKREASPFDCDQHDMTPLTYAAQYSSYDACEFLLKEGADPDFLAYGILTYLEIIINDPRSCLGTVDIPRLLSSDRDRGVDISWYRGTKEGFTMWQQCLDPLYYQRPTEERFAVAKQLLMNQNEADVLRLALTLDPLPSVAYSMPDSRGQKVLNVVARRMGDAMFWSLALVPSEYDERGLVERQLLLQDLIGQGANLHHISSGSSTPLVDLLQGLFTLEPLMPLDSDLLNDIGSLQCSRPWKLPTLINTWLECLQECGVDLEEYGRKETDLHQQGLVSWTWLPIGLEWGTEWVLQSLTYGPLPSDWKVEVQYRRRYADESLAKIPGAWIDDDFCE